MGWHRLFFVAHICLRRASFPLPKKGRSACQNGNLARKKGGNEQSKDEHPPWAGLALPCSAKKKSKAVPISRLDLDRSAAPNHLCNIRKQCSCLLLFYINFPRCIPFDCCGEVSSPHLWVHLLCLKNF